MLVAKQHKKLVLNLKNIDRVTTVIPTAKPFDFKGHTLVAVPHRTDEVRVLRNLGFDAPAPVSYYYDWPGVYTPFAHQKHMVEFMSTNPRCFNLGDMGTGKTLSVLWAYDWLRSVGELRRALIITPLSTLERTWGDEIFKHFSHLSFGVLHGTPERRLKVLAQEHDIYLVNHDGIKGKALFNALMKREDIDLVVVDEVAAFRNPGTDKWKALRKLVETKSWVWGLTGTPTPNEPTDAWGQCKLIVPEKVPRYRGQFTDMVMKKVSQFKWVPKADANDTVHSVMQPAIRYARKDCIDLPPTTYQTYEVELGPDQKRVYEDMLKKLKAEWEGGQLTAANEAVKMNKLLQIACLRYDTEVLTERGWVAITNVTAADRVWDGVEWVHHNGVAYMGDKPTVVCGGVHMTSDHRVLSSAGWVTAWEFNDGYASGRLDWESVRLPDGAATGGVQRRQEQESNMAVPMSLRRGGGARKPEPAQPTSPKREALRMPARAPAQDARDVSNTTLRQLAEHEAALPRPDGQGLQKLRRAWGRGVRTLARVLRELLGGHGSDIRARAYVGAQGQRRAVLAGELPMGGRPPAGQEPPYEHAAAHPERRDDFTGRGGRVRAKPGHVVGSPAEVRVAAGEVAEHTSPVYDILNCGPRNRFVARGSGAPIIVHNCGAAYDKHGNTVIIPAKQRLEVLHEIIEGAGAKVIVFVPIVAAVEAVAEVLAKRYEVGVIHGGTPKGERDRIFGAFQKTEEPRIIVAQPAAMSHGLTLTRANTIVWFAPITSNEVYEQANARIVRPGQKSNTLIAHIEGSDVERRMYDRLRKRGTSQGILLDMFQDKG